LLVEEIMKKNVIALTTADTVRDALRLMNEHKIRHLPILNDDEVVGIVSDRDIKEAAPSMLPEQKEELYDFPLSHVMTSNPLTGHPMDFVEELAVLFYEHQIGCLPIVAGGRLVGIITETDLLYNYIELTGAHQPGSQIEVRVPDVPGILFEVSKVFHEQNTNVLSVLVYPDKENRQSKILVIRIKTMNPLPIINGLKESGFDVLWPNFPGA